MEGRIEDPRFRAHYIQVYFSDETKIAWEFLRRNKTYQNDYETHLKWYRTSRHFENCLVDPSGFTDTEVQQLSAEINEIKHTQYPCPDNWGLAHYESPHLPCDEAAVHWLSPSASVEGRVRASPPRTRGRRRDPMDFVASRTCAITDHGRHTTIAHSGLQVAIRSDTLPFPSTDQTLEMAFTPARQFSKQVHDIFDWAPRDSFVVEMSRARLHRLLRFEWMLRGYDAKISGYTHKEIAELLFTPEKVKKEWSSGEDMRKRIERLLKRAQRLVDGGYRDLI